MSRKSAFMAIFDAFLEDPRGVIADLRRYARDVEGGADPIEALHGHICGPDCWHQQLGAHLKKEKKK